MQKREHREDSGNRQVEVLLDGPFYDMEDKLLTISSISVREMEMPPYSYVNVVFTTDKGISELNKEFFGVEGATDCIAFPYDKDDFVDDSGRYLLGEVYISVETADEQAKALGHSLIEELATLLIHSLLHLLGYDDQTEEERERMEMKTDEILSTVLSSYEGEKGVV